MENYIKIKYTNEEKYVYLTDENVNIKNIVKIENPENMSIKQMKKTLNKIKRKLNSYYVIDNKKIIAYIICKDVHNQKNIDMALAINALLIKNKIDKYNFLYDEDVVF